LVFGKMALRDDSARSAGKKRAVCESSHIPVLQSNVWLAWWTRATEVLPPTGLPVVRRIYDMLGQIGLLLTFQLAGELVVTGTGIPFPGPLCGMMLLLGYLYMRGGPSKELSVVASKFVDNLGLLFVPAGTAIVAYGALMAHDGLAVLAALVISTLVAIFVVGVIAERLAAVRKAVESVS
jgi:holin-like protein